MSIHYFFWILFSIFILGAVFYDLWLQGKRKKELSLKETAFWTGSWIFLALFFNLLIYFFVGQEKALEFFTAYLLEKSLSLDNLFVFLVIFSYFDLPLLLQQKVLKWGILGAFLMRAVFIFGGILLLEKFHFLFYLFGGLLIFSGIKMIFQKEEKVDPQKNFFLRIIKKVVPIVDDIKEGKFCLKTGGKFCLTPLFVILILIETSDVIFALDSVPAVLSITRDPFVAYTSNAFAILGLRALYFFLVGFLPKFVHLKKGIIFLLIFIGFKMALSSFYDISTTVSLMIILVVLLISILFSLIKNKNNEKLGKNKI